MEKINHNLVANVKWPKFSWSLVAVAEWFLPGFGFKVRAKAHDLAV